LSSQPRGEAKRTGVERMAGEPGELLLVRHGESEANVGRSADPDCPLTDRGHAQARDLGRRLAGLDLAGFAGVRSPYRRAAQTAAAIADATGLRFDVDPAVREWGVTATVDAAHYPLEPIEAVVDRLTTFLAHAAGRRLVVVGHAAPIALLTQLAWGEPPTTAGQFWLGVGNCRPRWVKVTPG
jgi:broad specificity phosphatase PhoE